MLQSMKTLATYNLLAENGECGKVSDLLFDDRDWHLRYLVADTGNWLPGRLVLLPPVSFGEPDPGAEVFPVALTKEQIESSPPISTDEPVSRRENQKIVLHAYPDMTPHLVRGPFDGPAAWIRPAHEEGDSDTATAVDDQSADDAETERRSLHLRSANEVIGYEVAASDGAVGHIDDLLVDQEHWLIRYAVVRMGGWLDQHRAILALPWISEIDYLRRQVKLDVAAEKVKSSPRYDPSTVLQRSFEEALYQYYQRKRYWQ